jgi:hypothetical protein
MATESRFWGREVVLEFFTGSGGYTFLGKCNQGSTKITQHSEDGAVTVCEALRFLFPFKSLENNPLKI